MGCIAVHWKEATPSHVIIANIHQDTEVLNNNTVASRSCRCRKNFCNTQSGSYQKGSFFVVPKRRMHNGIDQISKLLLSVDSNEPLKNKKIDDLCKKWGSNSSTSKEKKLMKKKQGHIGCSQGKALFVMFKLIYRSYLATVALKF